MIYLICKSCAHAAHWMFWGKAKCPNCGSAEKPEKLEAGTA